ncbi:Rubisco accumulation factor 1, alpha helical domain [Dillenia turbinata]|uniref:Rubisco accumulation factor 1, alpha helical domain n=1 Tax=Dillenia turbinata TaxID=194707 RepID=A0AAN8UEH5_9MAGN
MLSLTLNPTTTSLSPLHHHHHHHKPSFSSSFLPQTPFHHHPPIPSKPIQRPSSTVSASASPPPPSPQPQQHYQPFRLPPTPLPSQIISVPSSDRIVTLANRLGLWFDYAPLITSLIQDGFTSSSIEESTGISAVEQNRLIVATQVRNSILQSSQITPEVLSFFDVGGAELLYELRLLSATQRAAAARYVVEKKFDGKGAREVARAIKDFPRRKEDLGWEHFDCKMPGDCLAFSYFRLSREHMNPSPERSAALDRAMEVTETERARERILKELEGKEDGIGKEEDVTDAYRVPVVRMQVGEVAEATKVVVLPVCRAEDVEDGIVNAPWECRVEGDFGVVAAEKGWKRWVVFPGWGPVVRLGNGGVVVSFADARALPWRVNRWYKEEAILVVVNRGEKAVEAEDGLYLVNVTRDDGGGGLKVERGSKLKANGVEESLGMVVLVVRPPKEETDDQLTAEDWE